MEFQAGNIFIRTNEKPLKKGGAIKGDIHHFDHVTYCTYGALLVEREHPDGRKDQTELRPGNLPLLITKECKHTLTALEDNTGYHCIYAHRLPTGEVTEQYTGWWDAYT